jgi:uncharacterized membrane protein YfcA
LAVSLARAGEEQMSAATLLVFGLMAGVGAGLLAGMLGIGGGIVVVPVVYYGLISSGVSIDQAAHVAVGTSLAAILPAAITSSIAHWRAGNTDFAFLRQWGPGIMAGVVIAQFSAAYVRGSFLIAVFAAFCLVTAMRFAAPGRFRPMLSHPPRGLGRDLSGLFIGAVSGFAGVGGGILTNVVMTLSGMPMHKSVGRAAAVGVVVAVPATLVAALGPAPEHTLQLGSINLELWVCIAPAQAAAAWVGAQLTQYASADALSRLFALSLAATGVIMLHSSL